MSASFNIIFGDLPPNSRITLFILGYPYFESISLPTLVDPVNVTISTKWCSVRAYPTSPYPVRIFITPSGNPASLISSAIFKAVKGVYSAGFKTPVHPVANKGASFPHNNFKGKFQGIIPATTPTGCSYV
jgi:hypothetical protein